jgi:hypothetical protein
MPAKIPKQDRLDLPHNPADLLADQRPELGAFAQL